MQYKKQMKFLRKVLAVCLAMVFLIALIIGAGIILSVQNVNVRFEYYGENAYMAEYTQTRANLDKLKGSGLLFITTEDVESMVEDPDILAVESVTKVYPCSIDIVIRERAETFALKSENGPSYSVYDECGKLMNANVSSVDGADGCPNVIVSGLTASDMCEVAQMCAFFKESFSSFRRIVEEVSVVNFLGSKAFEFTLRSGFKIRIYDYKDADNNKQKIEKAFEKYDELTDLQKLSGAIDVISSISGGDPKVVYPGYSGI
ncbi:MAG: cell division protein FtsQ/DivIB [Candidatus Coproplasma sp.]